MSRSPLPDDRVRGAQELGRRLRRAREAAGLSREALARSMSAPLSIETLRKIEAGSTKSPELYTVVAIAHALELDLNELCAELI